MKKKIIRSVDKKMVPVKISVGQEYRTNSFPSFRKKYDAEDVRNTENANIIRELPLALAGVIGGINSSGGRVNAWFKNFRRVEDYRAVAITAVEMLKKDPRVKDVQVKIYGYGTKMSISYSLE